MLSQTKGIRMLTVSLETSEIILECREISHSVKRALQSCCQQLRAHLQKRNALRDQKERKSRLTKYIPDVTRSLFGLLEGMQQRREAIDNETSASSPRKRPRLGAYSAVQASSMLEQLKKGAVTKELIQQRLEETVTMQNSMEEQEAAAKEDPAATTPLYLVPLFDRTKSEGDVDVIDHPLFSFQPIRPVSP